MGSGPDVIAPLALEDALARLASPHESERFSPLLGTPVLVVRVDAAAAGTPPETLAAARVALERLACPSLAVSPDPEAAPTALLERFDVVVRTEDELAPLLATIDCAPLASLALVQLLRQNAHLDIHQGLVAESLVYSVLQSGPEFAAWLESTPKPARALPDSEPAVRIERWDEELVLSLNRPRRHNAFSVEIRDALAEGLQLAVADDSLRRVVLRGEGPSFCSGGDLSEFGDLPDPATAHAVRSTRSPARLLASCADRVTARVHGACIGAGVELPAFAHRIVAKPDAFFALPEVAMGLVPGAGGTASIPRRIGRQRTAWMALSGARVDAETALDWGLIDEIAD